MTSSLFRWLSLATFIILIYCSFLSAMYVTSSMDEISSGVGAYAPIITGIVATASVAMALRTIQSEVHRSWQLLLVGLVLWTLADLIWGIEEIWGLSQESYFSFADFIWIVGYVPIAMAIWFYLPRLRSLLRDIRKVIVLTIICVLPMGAFVLQLVSLLSSPELVEDGLVVLTPAIYPALDLILAGGGLLIAICSRRQTWRWPWFLIGGALVLWSYSDAWYAIVVLQDWFYTQPLIRLSVDLSYTVAYLILAVGASLAMQSDIFRVVADDGLSTL